jgi:uncharacterized protein
MRRMSTKQTGSQDAQDDDIRPEYDFAAMPGGVRGKYYKAYRAGYSVTVHHADGTETTSTHMTPLITIEQARALYPQDGSAHGFEHVLRVLKLAERIGAEEGADLQIVRAATLLHDVARGRPGDHALLGATQAREILAGAPAEVIEAVAHAIAAHRFRGDVAPATLEARVLSDADKLDAIGAFGIARAYAIAGEAGQRLWAAVSPADYPDIRAIPDAEHTPVHEYVYKLARLKDRLYTPAARRIAEGRHAFMQAFFAELDLEVAGVH